MHSSFPPKKKQVQLLFQSKYILEKINNKLVIMISQKIQLIIEFF